MTRILTGYIMPYLGSFYYTNEVLCACNYLGWLDDETVIEVQADMWIYLLGMKFWPQPLIDYVLASLA